MPLPGTGLAARRASRLLPDTMSIDPNSAPLVYPTLDGERSTAGTNYGDWRPAHPPRPHGYDFESRFQPAAGPAALDPDYRRLRDEHERELDEHYPHWLEMRYRRFSEEFDRWREERGARAADGETGSNASPR